MNEKQTKTVRLGLKVLAAAACVLALIGSIGLLATIGKVNRLITVAMSGSSSSQLEAMSAMTSVTNLYSLLDLARFGAFAAFLLTAFYAAIEIITKSNEKIISIITVASSVLGFVGCFFTSITAMYKSILSPSGLSSIMASAIGSSGSNTEALAAKMIRKMFGPMTIGGIFILIASAAVIIFLIVSFIKPKTAANTYFINAAQGYPDQQYPGQPYPNQQYPNQAYPDQQYPNQPYPGQQYPGQAYSGQAPLDDRQQNHNDFIPQ